MTAQGTTDVEQQVLGAAGEAVMADQQNSTISIFPRSTNECARGGVEIGGAKMKVGLQVCGFAPFVPCVDAYDRFAEKWALHGAVNELAQP